MKKIVSTLFFLFFLLASVFGQSPTQVIISGDYIVLSVGGTGGSPVYMVVNNSNTNAISILSSGWIISENEFNIVQWNIGTSTGTYVVPFGYSTLNYIPVTLNIGTAGVGSGVIKFSTYHTIADQYTGSPSVTGDPTDVTNLNAFISPASPGATENSYNIVDRFYIIDANTGYTTKPAAGNITFTYIHSGAGSEIASPNILTESNLMAERFNSSSNTWSDWFGKGCTDAITSSLGTVQTGPVTAANMFRSWSLWDNRSPLPLTITSTNVLCSGSSTGSATVTAYGGVSPYTYSWAPAGGSSATASGLSAGTYTITVTDNVGCSSTSSISILSYPLHDSISAYTNSCVGSTNGTATAGVKYGTSPYTYTWSPGGQTNVTATGLSGGTYSVTVTDSTGCTATTSVVIAYDTLKVSVSPSPSTICPGSCSTLSAIVYEGQSPFTYAWSPGSGSSSTYSVCPAVRATYMVTVHDNFGCAATSSKIAIVTFSPGHCIVFH